MFILASRRRRRLRVFVVIVDCVCTCRRRKIIDVKQRRNEASNPSLQIKKGGEEILVTDGYQLTFRRYSPPLYQLSYDEV